MCPAERGQRGPAEVRSQEIGHYYNIIIILLLTLLLLLIILLLLSLLLLSLSENKAQSLPY